MPMLQQTSYLKPIGLDPVITTRTTSLDHSNQSYKEEEAVPEQNT